MNTIITLSDAGLVSSITNIELNKKIYDLHPDATSRITVFSGFKRKKSNLKELLGMIDMEYYLSHVVQFIEYTGRKRPKKIGSIKPDFVKFEIDLRL